MGKLFHSELAQILLVLQAASQPPIAFCAPNQETARERIEGQIERSSRRKGMWRHECGPANEPAKKCGKSTCAQSANVRGKKHRRIKGRKRQERGTDKPEGPADER